MRKPGGNDLFMLTKCTFPLTRLEFCELCIQSRTSIVVFCIITTQTCVCDNKQSAPPTRGPQHSGFGSSLILVNSRAWGFGD